MAPIRSVDVLTGIHITHEVNREYAELRLKLTALSAVKQIVEAGQVAGTDLQVAVIIAHRSEDVDLILRLLASEGVAVPSAAGV